MRILVVDDEIVSRTKMETLMLTFGEVTTAERGAQAAELYFAGLKQDNAYHLVMLDIDMPDMQGTDVLHKIREMENGRAHRAIVLMVTAQSAQEQVVTCIQGGCNDFIAKPFNINIIRNKLRKFGINGDGVAGGMERDASSKEAPLPVDAIFKDINATLRSGELVLPAMPQIGLKFQEMVRNNAGLGAMAELLKQDVVIASKLLRLANSAVYRGYEKAHRLDQAIGRLGLAQTEQMVMAIANQKLFMVKERKYNDILQNLWSHSLACAYGAEAVAQTRDRKLPVDPFTAGLFHDIGAFALIYIIAELEKRGRYGAALATETLCDTVATYHPMFSAKLMEKWEFGPDYVLIGRYHNDISAAESNPEALLLVHFANLMAKTLGYTFLGGGIEVADLIDMESARRLDLSPEQIVTLQENVEAKMAQIAEMADEGRAQK
jgi:HD-like signal output (HDOD) protein